MLHLLWDMFKETGQVSTYMFYKAMEKEYMNDESKIDQIEGFSDGASMSHVSQSIEDLG